MSLINRLDAAAASVRKISPEIPVVGLVLGSGLGSFASRIANAARIPYSAIPGFIQPTAEGHAGELVLGEIGGVRVACMAGRIHQYEGHSANDVVFGVRLLGRLGIRRLLLTNAAGGLNPEYSRGELVLISDHINMQFTNPLIGPNEEELGPRFPDMTEAYPRRLREVAREAGRAVGLELKEGVYVALLGPSFETPAEIRAFRTLGADLVGMSTVPEVIAASHMGVECLGISCVTNLAAGISSEKLSHQEVLETGEMVKATFEKLIESLVPRLG